MLTDFEKAGLSCCVLGGLQSEKVQQFHARDTQSPVVVRLIPMHVQRIVPQETCTLVLFRTVRTASCHTEEVQLVAVAHHAMKAVLVVTASCRLAH